MAKYVLAYTGGSAPEEADMQESVMKEWMDWFGTLGSSVIDGGNPFAASTAVRPNGETGPTESGLSGYSIIEADDLDQAAKLAGGCPVLNAGGSVEVFETIPM